MKLLLTLGVILVALYVIRTRRRKEPAAVAAVDQRKPSPVLSKPSLGSIFKWTAYALAGLMILASFFYLMQAWNHDQSLVDVRVVNPYTGKVQDYQAKRGDIEGRVFTTTDGRRIQIAEMERLIVTEPRGD